MATVIELNDITFPQTVAEGMTLVDFWAPWCAPCTMQGPIVERVAQEVRGGVTVAKVNVDEAPKSANAHGIRAIPTVILFKDGKVVQQFVGVTQEGALLAAIEEAQ